MNLTTEQFEKLPLYVRHEIERLDSNVAYWQRKATAGPADSDTFVEHYGGLGELATPLGHGPTVTFYRDGRTRDSVDGWQHRFDVYLRGEELRVSGGDGILVRPYAGNVVCVRHGR